jgi:DNA helicase-2/ATP-dependent DNA helicase PcrA
VLVDEAQDTNGAQWKVIETLTTYPVDHEPNLFVVGDDDQAIYRFQGANLRNMMSFHERFPKAPVIPLTVSYRSTQVILDAAQSLIEKNEERLVGRIPGLVKNLTAFTKEEGTQPQLLMRLELELEQGQRQRQGQGQRQGQRQRQM